MNDTRPDPQPTRLPRNAPRWPRMTAVALMVIGALTILWLLIELIKSTLSLFAAVLPFLILAAVAVLAFRFWHNRT